MKRFHSVICTLFAAALLALPARADDALFTGLPFDSTDVTTVITDTRGGEHTYSGALDASGLADAPEAAEAASYALMRGG